MKAKARIRNGFELFVFTGKPNHSTFCKPYGANSVHINYEQGRDRAIIQEANLKTKTVHVESEAGNARRNSNTDHPPNFRSDHPLFETKGNFDLTSLLNGHVRSDDRDIDQQADIHGDGGVMKKRRKKKRRGRRL